MRRGSRIVGLVTIATIAVSGLAVGTARAGTGSLDLLADNWSAASASADGSRIAFVSTADGQVHVRDLANGVDTLVSTANGTTGADGFQPTRAPKISRNGRFVTFETSARNLDARDTDFLSDIYLKDLSSGALTLVSTTSTGVKANLASRGPAPVSDTGTVVFTSEAGNFPPVTALPSDCFPGETFCMEDEIYAKSLSGALTLVSLGTRGDFQGATSGSIFADISADGTKVAVGTMDPLAPDDTDQGNPDIVVVDLTTGLRTLASTAPGGFYFPSLSADGSRVVFQGSVISPTLLLDQVFVRDLTQSAPVLVSQNAVGQAANDVAQDAVLTSDGQYVAYSTRATNLHPDDTDGIDDILLKDLSTGALRLVSVRDDGTKEATGGGSQPVQALTGGTGVVFSSSLRTFNPSDTTFGFGFYLKQLSPLAPPPPADGNGDGVLDSLQPTGTATGAFVDASTTPVTSGNVVSTGGLTVSIADATDAADGVLVTVGASASTTARATISACGVTLRLTPSSSAVITCGSVIVRTLTGSVQAVLDNGLIVVTIPAGSSARVSDTATGAQVTQVVGSGVTVTVNGRTTSLAAGGTTAYASWSAPGFSAPVDNAPVLNSTKAGRAVPLKWHLTDASGAPVTNLTTATVTVQNLSCGLGVTTDELEETFAGASGLQNQGNGDYQLNWKTNSAWAGSCKTMVLDLGGGVMVTADFRFAK